MSAGIEAIQAVGAQATESLGARPTEAAHPGFAAWVGNQVESLNTQLVGAEKGVQALAAGEVANLHDVMLQLEQARLAMQLASQVRSRVLEAYQEVMRMQV